MKRIAWRHPLALAAAAGVVVIFGCAGAGSRPAAPAGMVWVAVVQKDIASGSVVEANDIRWVAFPSDYVPDAAITEHELYAGRRAQGRLLKNEFLREERLAPGPGGPSTDDAVAPSAPVKPGEDMVMAIVAARDLKPGAKIAEADLYAVQVPPRFLADHVFLSPQPVVGRTVCELTLANEIVRAERLGEPSGSCPAAGAPP